MNLSELRARVRLRIRDTAKPYLCSDEEIDANINEAQREACSRALLIDDSTIEIDIDTSELRYSLDSRIIDVIRIENSAGTEYAGWTLTETELVLDRLPSAADTLTLHCYLLPTADMASDSDEPEIRPVYHTQMIDWAISLCYLVPDADLYNKDAADRYAASFTQAFGERITAQARRNHRSKTSKTVMSNGAF